MKAVYQICAILVLTFSTNSCRKEEKPYDDFAHARSLIPGLWHVKSYVADGVNQLEWHYFGDTSTYACTKGGTITCIRNRSVVRELVYNFDESGIADIYNHEEYQILNANATMDSCKCVYAVWLDNKETPEAQWLLEKGTNKLDFTFPLQPVSKYDLIALADHMLHFRMNDGTMVKEDIVLEK